MNSGERLMETNRRRNPGRGKLALEVGAAVTLVSVLFAAERAGFYQEASELKEKVSTSLARDPNWGKAIEKDQDKALVTDKLGEISEIPLRSEPSLDDDNIIGWTKPGQIVLTDGEIGAYYNSQYNFDFTKDGHSYSEWYKAQGLDLYERTDSGELVPVLDNDGKQKKSGEVHIAANFLRLPTEEELKENLPNER